MISNGLLTALKFYMIPLFFTSSKYECFVNNCLQNQCAVSEKSIYSLHKTNCLIPARTAFSQACPDECSESRIQGLEAMNREKTTRNRKIVLTGWVRNGEHCLLAEGEAIPQESFVF